VFFVSGLQGFRFFLLYTVQIRANFMVFTPHPMVFPVFTGERLESPEFFGRE
jgi:hypothetical protein